MDRFVKDRNLERYRKLACAATTRAEREMLFALLAEEKVKCFVHQPREITIPVGDLKRILSQMVRDSNRNTPSPWQETN